jgi:hypothetical protein
MAFGDTVPSDEPRWATDTSGTTSNVSPAPVAQRKTVGIQESDTVPYNWLNFLFATIWAWIKYFQTTFEDIFDDNFVARDGVTTNASVGETSPASMAVRVEAGKVWIQGAYYALDAANVTIAPADATNPRYDVVVADVTGGVATYTKVTGTPAGSPTVPAIGAAQVRLAVVEVPAASATVITSRITDKRRRGAGTFGALKAVSTFQLGDIGGGNYAISFDEADGVVTFDGPMTQLFADETQIADATQICKIGGLGGGNWALRFNGTNAVLDSTTAWRTTQTRKFNIPAATMSRTNGTINTTGKVVLSGGVQAYLHGAVNIPDGAVVTALRVYLFSDDPAQTVTAELMRRELATNTQVSMASVTLASHTGDESLEDATISNATIDNDAYGYFVYVNADNGLAATSTEIRMVQVEYTVSDVAMAV